MCVYRGMNDKYFISLVVPPRYLHTIMHTSMTSGKLLVHRSFLIECQILFDIYSCRAMIDSSISKNVLNYINCD